MKNLEFPTMDFGFAHEVTCAFIREEVDKYGFKGAVVALSGGLDSSMIALLCHTALNGKVSLFFMPYGSQITAENDVRKMADMLGAPMENYNIQPLCDQICNDRHITDVKRKGNIMARLRMNLLFDLSARDYLLVVGTSNKTELLTGYSTWFGDSAAAILPIGDLYKTQVRGLAQHCGIPMEIIQKAPSAELWENQTDEDEMGISYSELDRILYYWIDQRYAPKKIVELGIPKKTMQQVLRLCRKALYKHKLPIICKMSDRTIALDYRLNKENILLADLDF